MWKHFILIDEIIRLSKYFLLCTVIFLFNLSFCFGQLHPLSKHDSSLIVKYTQEYEILSKTQANMKDASQYLNDIAYIYWEHNQYNEAIKFYKRSLLINAHIENENGIAMINNNLGMLHADILDYNTSYTYFTQTLAARRSNDQKTGMISALINRSVILNNLLRYDESTKDLEEALNLAREMNDVDQMKSCYGMLSETFEKAGNPKKSIYYFGLYKTFTNMIQEEKITDLMNDYSEEKLMKQKLEIKNKKNQEELASKQRKLKLMQQQNKQYDSRLDEYDSLNKSLYENLSEKELQLEVMTKESEIMQLKAKQEIQVIQLEKEREKRINQFTLTFTIGLILVVLIIIRYFWMARTNAAQLQVKNEKIEQQGIKLQDLNNNLQQKVEERTETLQTAYKKLSELIFLNSHEIRRPVANISGLLNLFNTEQLDDPQNLELLKLLKMSNQELDEVLIKWNKNLSMESNPIETRSNE